MSAEAALVVINEQPGARESVSPGRQRPLGAFGSPDCLLRREGEYWTVVYGGQAAQIRDSVGLRHLAQLLRHPRREFHALDLMRALALAGDTRGGRPPRDCTSAIDQRAATAYRHRLRDLQEELVDAEALGDLGRVESLRRDVDALIGELRAGTDGRLLRDDAERARLAVTKAIKAAIARIRPCHDAFALHLEAAVRRGYVCVYQPDPRCPTRWEW